MLELIYGVICPVTFFLTVCLRIAINYNKTKTNARMIGPKYIFRAGSDYHEPYVTYA